MPHSLPNTSVISSPAAIRAGWDTFDAYLFDIDGTLTREPNRVHVLAFAETLHEIIGRAIPLEGVTVHGSTDAAILRDACLLAGIHEDEYLPLRPRIFSRLNEMVLSRRERMQMVRIAGTVETLDYLQQRGAVLGVGTGNLEEIGWLKLELAGLRQYFRFGGFSDRFAIRADMIAHAAEEARAIAGSKATLCVVGDTPSDVTAARANNIPTIAVATGIYSTEQLSTAQPEWCVNTLEDLLKHTVSSAASSNTQSTSV